MPGRSARPEARLFERGNVMAKTKGVLEAARGEGSLPASRLEWSAQGIPDPRGINPGQLRDVVGFFGQLAQQRFELHGCCAGIRVLTQCLELFGPEFSG